MKKFLIIVGFVLLVIIGYRQVPVIHHALSYSPCNTPLTYKIGSVDSRFGLSSAEVRQDVDDSANIWNTAMNKPIFAYAPDGKVTINLVYDQRQKLSSQINNLQKQIDTDKSSLDPQIQDYKARSAAFDQKLAALNQEIDYWNAQGGAPPDQYQKITQEQTDLKIEAQELNAVARSLNQSTRDYNAQVGQLNQTESRFNQTLVTKPEEGLWNGNDNTISIYFNNSHDELIHTLAHELGHARGLDHNSDQSSIMYPSSTEDITPSSSDLSDLQNICKERSDAEIVIQGYVNLIHSLEARFSNS